MYNQFTITFREYLDNGGLVPPILDKIPNFKIYDLDLNFKELFISRNELKEIGAETSELFYKYMIPKCNEMAIKYIPLINSFIDNFTKLFDRTVLESGKDSDSDFINPINEDNAKLQNLSKKEYEHNRSFGFFKTNAEIMAQVMKLESIYNDALQYLDNLFMGVL